MRDFNRGGRDDRGGRGRDDRGDRGGRQGGGRLEMHHAVCSDCGCDCEVPFRPTGSKPVFCSRCFQKDGGNDSFRSDRGGRDDRGGRGDRGRNDYGRNDYGRSNEREMHKATCSDCGCRCEVPFRPSGDKPVFCTDCFGNNGSNTRSKAGADHTDQFEELNEKLDEIFKLLVKIKPRRSIVVNKDDVGDMIEEREGAERDPEIDEENAEEKAPKKTVKKVAKKAVKKVAKKTVKKVAKKTTEEDA
ncbi:hypothetical protein COB57_00015 [Candidatus Peregrinibacteria bacterium]|nr:MAG: hypothetical protein COB57_00015 [Candidatus Peregrinibacteria bacterium]